MVRSVGNSSIQFNNGSEYNENVENKNIKKIYSKPTGQILDETPIDPYHPWAVTLYEEPKNHFNFDKINTIFNLKNWVNRIKFEKNSPFSIKEKKIIIKILENLPNKLANLPNKFIKIGEDQEIPPSTLNVANEYLRGNYWLYKVSMSERNFDTISLKFNKWKNKTSSSDLNTLKKNSITGFKLNPYTDNKISKLFFEKSPGVLGTTSYTSLSLENKRKENKTNFEANLKKALELLNEPEIGMNLKQLGKKILEYNKSIEFLRCFNERLYWELYDDRGDEFFYRGEDLSIRGNSISGAAIRFKTNKVVTAIKKTIIEDLLRFTSEFIKAPTLEEAPKTMNERKKIVQDERERFRFNNKNFSRNVIEDLLDDLAKKTFNNSFEDLLRTVNENIEINTSNKNNDKKVDEKKIFPTIYY